MQASQQGISAGAGGRYQVVPRTLIFVTSINPENGNEDLLLIKGAPTKRLWANKYNGIGGHVEPGEDFLAGAQRELAEETGLRDVALTLVGVLNIAVRPDGDPPSGVAVFVFSGQTASRTLNASREGELHWVALADVESLPLVDDLYQLLPLLRNSQTTIYGQYQPDDDGAMIYRFRVPFSHPSSL
ncbi:MAG: NUDIX domain-containing protein [Caldilineaceae bacterium]|nr:NUDIX domain-containing protein [Caldilineaceae bacterium]